MAVCPRFPVIIKGEFITLSQMMETDAEFIYNLRKSKSARFLNCPEGYSIESQKRWQLIRPSDEVNYIIYTNYGYRVGMVSIYECEWANRVSNVGRLLLREEFVHKSTPYGLEALKMTYSYVFNVMNFKKISGTINSRNLKVVSLQKYLGMIEEGYFMNHVLLDGVSQDLYFLSLFKEDFLTYETRINQLLDKFRHGRNKVNYS